VASIREVPRKDGGVTFQVLYRIDGRQSSLTLGDRTSAEKFQALVEQVGPGRALEIHDAGRSATIKDVRRIIREELERYFRHRDETG